MLFRGWYHACQLGLIGFAIVMLGAAIPGWRLLTTVGMCIVAPLGIIGAMLGVLLVTRGIRSACPLCGTSAYWTSPAQSVIAVACQECGLVGGNPAWDARPRKLHEYDDNDASDDADDAANR
jgi:hypothetical protein